MQAVASLLVLLWFTMVVIAIIGLMRGRLDWAGLRNRKQSGWLLAASFIVMLLIGLIEPERHAGDNPTPTPSTTTTFATDTKPTASPTTTTAEMTTATTTTTTLPLQQPLSRAPFAPAPAPGPSSPSVYYSNCTEARAAGAAPLLRGAPGYRSELDRDNDGVACEV
ncbi:excalibur calcium-binding domain-containing protein [Nocardia sp. XZ_19_385]|uniref:excalibur calcium-binding domain-containing protein n=1 Tax=Nocardia sp. XZ_19_385 TaxID=2769488 RepID=UPI001E2A98C0|nr:excalibur calcium-binding domain-containing protein [Nocardia sp. XZ_19_385]